MIGPRRRSRETALQVLHVLDVSPELGAEGALARTFGHLVTARGIVEDVELDVRGLRRGPAAPAHGVAQESYAAVEQPEHDQQRGDLDPPGDGLEDRVAVQEAAVTTSPVLTASMNAWALSPI